MNNILFKKKINNKYCHFYVTKTGKIKFLPKLNHKFLCAIKSKYLYYYEEFDIFKINNNKFIIDNYIINNLLILYNLFKIDLSYIIINRQIHIFHNKIYDNVIKLLSLNIISKKSDSKIYKYFFEGNLIKDLTIEFMMLKLIFNEISNLELLTILFYQSYIKSYEIKKILLKYNKNLLSFENHHKLYMFLKKIGIVEKYYNNYSKKIIKNYIIIYKKLSKYIEKNNLNDFFFKKTKYFKDVNPIEFILKIIDKYINNDLKEYIKFKFIKIIENYNIK